jgi:ATP-dependent DNA helicase RecG
MDKKELDFILQQGEGQFIEFKENLDKSLGKEICAFANASGGRILLGVTDDKKIKGFTLTNSIKSQIQDIAKNTDPSFKIEVNQVENITIVNVPEGKEKPYQVSGEFYLRQGASSPKLKRNEVRDLFQKENHITFERQLSEFDLKSDFNNVSFKYFIDKANISKNLSLKHILHNLGLLTDGKPNNACALMFSNRITNFFLSADISCVLYQGTSKADMLDKKVFDIDFISNFENAVVYIEKYKN